MKKYLTIFCVVLSFCLMAQSTFSAKQCDKNVCPLNDVLNAENSNENLQKSQISNFVKNFEILQNKHDLVGLKKIYSEEFVNTDGFNRNQLFTLMKKTFENYPDFKSSIQIENIVVLNDYAMVFIKQDVNATTKAISKITGDKGSYTAVLQSILYLKKINNSWKIYSENVIFENSKLAFGTAKNVNASLNVPQKVLVDTDYCAGVNIDLPVGFSAIASINNTQIIEGFGLSGETFRQVPPDKASLERVLRANNNNNNEAVVASVGFTQTSEDMFKKPKVDISGLLMLMKRVDIIPETTNLSYSKESERAEK